MQAHDMQNKPRRQDLAPLTDAVLSWHPKLRPHIAGDVSRGWDSIVARALRTMGADLPSKKRHLAPKATNLPQLARSTPVTALPVMT